MIARLRADTRTLPVLALIVAIFGVFAAGNATFVAQSLANSATCADALTALP